MNDNDTSNDLFRIFRNRLLVLLSTSVALIGIALIIVAQFTSSGWHESLVGIGAAIFATGPITAMVWWVTDDMYRSELSSTLSTVVDKSLAESDRLNAVAREGQRLGIVNVQLQRVDALNLFKEYLTQEIERAQRGQSALLWFVCTDLKGFLEVALKDSFDTRKFLKHAADLHKAEKLDLRILMADPEDTLARSENGDDSETRRQQLYAPVERLQSELGVQDSSIKFYAWKPTVFAIATSQYMLLNPYPQFEEAHRCMSLIVTKTRASEQDDADIYSQYLRNHFSRNWEADTTRKIDRLPRLVSRIKLSRDANEANALLEKELKEVSGAPPASADLIDFTGNQVRDPIERLAKAGARVRLLLKHPDSVGKGQQQNIINSYVYLKEHVRSDLFQIKFYRTPPSICGWRLDGRLLNVGWCLPDILPSGKISQSEIIEDGPKITADPGRAESQALNEMFSRSFDGLWNGGATSAEVETYIKSL